MVNLWNEFVYSVSCFSKLTQDICKQQLTLPEEEDVEPTKLRILLINCQSDNVAQQLEQATHKTTIRTIIFLYASEEHFAIAKGYLERLNFPLLFVEEKCEEIVRLISKYPEMMAEVSVNKNKKVPLKTQDALLPLVTKKCSLGTLMNMSLNKLMNLFY